jgi:hypothetical protein
MSAHNISKHEYLTNEAAAATLAVQTTDPAAGLLLITVWGDSAWVMEGVAGNESLSPGARERAEERLSALIGGDAR